VAETFRCTIVTPAAAVFDAEVRYASFPAWDGQVGVLYGQSPQLTRLGIGPMRVDEAEGASRWYLVEGGFAQVHENVLTILTERATPAEELSVSQAEAELKDANARAIAGGEDRVKVEADQRRARSGRALAQAAGSGGQSH